LNRNQRQSRAEERMLGRNVLCPQGNVQPRRGVMRALSRKKVFCAFEYLVQNLKAYNGVEI